MQIFYIVIGIFMFGILVAVHEFGHFIVAKLCGVRVIEFSIGMGPLIWGREGEETKYSFRAIPIGGYCAFDGEDNDTRDERSLPCQGYVKQVLIFVAGVTMNVLLAFVVMLGLYHGAEGFYVPVLTGLAQEVSAEVTLQAGDELYRIDGERVYLYSDVSTLLSMGDGDGFDMVVIRDGEKVDLGTVPLVYQTYTSQTGEDYQGYGLFLGEIVVATPMVIVQTSWNTVLNFARSVRMSFQMLFNGEAGIEDMSGPVGIVETISEVGTSAPTVWIALENIAYLGAFLSVNLAVLNLLPIPALDGGRIVFLTVDTLAQKLFRKKIPDQYMNAINGVFFILLFGFIILITFKDVFTILKGFLPFLG